MNKSFRRYDCSSFRIFLLSSIPTGDRDPKTARMPYLQEPESEPNQTLNKQIFSLINPLEGELLGSVDPANSREAEKRVSCARFQQAYASRAAMSTRRSLGKL